jgi:hypothetical protein
MRTDRKTEMRKLIVAFRNFANAPKNWDVLKHLKIVIIKCIPHTYAPPTYSTIDFGPTSHTYGNDIVGITLFTLLFYKLLMFAFVKLR